MIPEIAVAVLGLRPHRRRPFGRVRRVLAGQPRRPHPRLPLDLSRHRRRGAARRPHRAVEAQRRRRTRKLPGREGRDRRAPHRRCDRLGRRPRHLVSRGLRRRLARLPARGDVGRGPAVHPLHLGLDRSAQGRAAHHRRLSRLRRDDPRIRLRLPRRRGLLVHRRCRLGDRAQLHRLRAARQRRHHPDVRGGAELPRPVALLAGRRQAPGQRSSTPRRPRSAP